MKDFLEDVTQARDTLNRTLEMYNESRAWEVPQAASSTANPVVELVPPTQEEFAKLQELIKKSNEPEAKPSIVVIKEAFGSSPIPSTIKVPNLVPLVPLTATARIVREVQNVAGCSMKHAKEMTTQAIIYFNKGGVQSAITYLAGASTQAQQIWDAIEKLHAFECNRMHQAVLTLAEYASTDVDVLKIRDAIQAAMAAYNVRFQGGASSGVAIKHGTNYLMDTLKQKGILDKFDIEHTTTFTDLFARIVDIFAKN